MFYFTFTFPSFPSFFFVFLFIVIIVYFLPFINLQFIYTYSRYTHIHTLIYIYIYTYSTTRSVTSSSFIISIIHLRHPQPYKNTLMNTPPPESEFPKPEPVPSFSMPVLQPPLANASPPPNYRRRRHTITQPDASIELLPDGVDNEHEDQALDRISGILSTLLQEANKAVQNNGVKSFSPNNSRNSSRPRPHSALLRSSTTTNNNTSSSRPKSILSLSRLPRPTRSSQHQRTHDRHSSISSSTSSASLFSPAPTTAESPITASSMEQQSNYFLNHQQTCDKNNNYHHDDDIIDLLPTEMLQESPSASLFEPIYNSGTDMIDETRRTRDDYDTNQFEPSSATTTQYILPRFDDPLMESFRRLDSSMAMVESLSRDLAQQQQNYDDDDEMGSLTATATDHYHYRPRFNSFISSTSTSRLALLFLPLLHIPHALITTVFDTLISSPGNNQSTTWKWSTSSSSSFVNASSSFSGIVAWTICFALANIVVTWSGVPSPYRFLTQQLHSSHPSSADIVRPRRLSLPGSYQPTSNSTNGNWILEKEYNHRMERSKRPAPINTTLCVKKSSAYHSVRRTPIKRSTPFTSSSSARKRNSNHHQRQPHQQLLSSTSMAVSQSNDRSYSTVIQQSRALKKQQQQQQQIPDGWEWMDGDNQQPFTITRRRHSF
ncbi:unnamed protein product [Absidia cylindrospora]